MTHSKNRPAPPPPSSNRTCRFPASGFPKNTSLAGMRRQSRLGRRAEALPRNEVGRSLFWEQCSMCILIPFARHVLGRAPWLRGHYSASLLLRAHPTPARAGVRLWVPALRWRSSGEPPLERVSQVPDDSVGIRRPLSPRRARPLQAFVASRSMAGFTPPGGLATLTCLTRPNTGSRLRITADAFAFQGSGRRIAPTAARSATWRTNNYHGQYLSTDKNRQALPDAPGGNRGNRENRDSGSLRCLRYLLVRQAKLDGSCQLKGTDHGSCSFAM